MTGRWDARSISLLLGVLVVATVIIVRGITVGEFSYNVDETQHAVTGLYFADVVRDRPFTNLVEYTYRYYAQYPALSGVIHWPPLFYCFEGLSFLILGPSVIAARLTILLFALLAIVFWFLLAKELLGEWAAAFSSLWLALLPAVLLFEKTVMLEVPCLACCLGASFFWIVYLLKGRKADLYWCAIWAAAALLTKQNGIYLVPFFVLSGLVYKGWRLFAQTEMLRAMAIGFLLALPFYLITYIVHWKTIAMDLNEPASGTLNRWLFYPGALPTQIGWVPLVLAVLGLVTCRQWSRTGVPGIMLSWIVACYVTLTLIGHKEARYSIYWIPPFLFFASGLLFQFFRKPWRKMSAAVTATVVLGTALASAWLFHRPYVTGYAAIPRKILEESKSGVVLFDGPLPGNFIFFMRADDPARQFVVLRKALYAYQIKASGGSTELVHSPDEIEGLLHEDGVRFIVTSEGVPFDFASQAMLREVLKAPAYREMGRFPVGGDDVSYPSSSLVLYENLNWAPPTAKWVRVRMLTMDHDIAVPWSSFPGLWNK